MRSLRALLLIANETDAEFALAFLRDAQISADTCGCVDAVRSQLSDDVGCIVVSGDLLSEMELIALRDLLDGQPRWSDLPLILISAAGTSLSAYAEQTFSHTGNMTLLEQPLRPATLVSSVRVALRAREHQLEVHDLVEDREQALRTRDEFLAMLAHELRNPLAPMRNAVYLQRLLRIQDPIFEKTRDIFDRQTTNLSRMVDDLLDVARLERGKVLLERKLIDLNQSVTGATDTCTPLTQARRHRVEVNLWTEPLFIDADPVRVEQLLTNLVTNAAKFTPEAGTITITSRQEGGMAVVSVTDTGVGLSDEMLATVFHPFKQADQTLARSHGGLGLGLAIARRLAELHGGTLNATSAGPDKGSTFTLCFPLASRRPAESSASEINTRGLRRKRVLVVEDNSDIRESLRMVLEVWGHDVTLADNGPRGIELAAQVRPEIALIDIGLPILDGYEVARNIRATTPHNGVKLVAITGYGQPADRERALTAGFDAHMLKPIDPQVLQTLFLD